MGKDFMTLILRAEIIIGNRIGECINNFKCPFIKKNTIDKDRSNLREIAH